MAKAETIRQGASKKLPKFRKAPQAPKRFKSAFIFFSSIKHPEIRKEIEVGENNDVTSVAKLVSKAWREISPEERAVWDKLAEDDKKRYEVERKMYTGPWKIPSPKRTKKDPNAPKRPMSAFLEYSKKNRSKARAENPHLKCTEISRLLGKIWREASEEERRVYVVKEAKEREKYKVAIAEWRTNKKEKIMAERMQREEFARMIIANETTAMMTPKNMTHHVQQDGYPIPPSICYSYSPPGGDISSSDPSVAGYSAHAASYGSAGYPQSAREEVQGYEYWSNTGIRIAAQTHPQHAGPGTYNASYWNSNDQVAVPSHASKPDVYNRNQSGHMMMTNDCPSQYHDNEPYINSHDQYARYHRHHPCYSNIDGNLASQKQLSISKQMSTATVSQQTPATTRLWSYSVNDERYSQYDQQQASHKVPCNSVPVEHMNNNRGGESEKMDMSSTYHPEHDAPTYSKGQYNQQNRNYI